MASKALVVQFLPDPVQYKHNQPRDRETAKRIRSHIAGNLRRKKLQVLLNPTGVPLPSETEEAQVNGTTKFCTCVILQNASPSKEDAKSKVLQKQRAIADSYKICQRCHKVQFLELSWLGQLKAARQRIPSVTPFLESEFDPFESLPELAYYKQTPQSKRMLNEIKAHLVIYVPYERFRNVVLSTASTDPALFMGLLYASSSHLEAVRDGVESPLSLAIKSEAMRQINIRLNDPKKRNTSATLAAISYLSSGVLAVGAKGAIAETDMHERGIFQVWNDGLGGEIPPDCILGHTLRGIFVLHQMSRAATFAQPPNEEFVAGFCQPSRVFAPDEFLPESPVYCPRSDFYTIKKSPKCSLYTLRILRGLKNLIDSMIEEEEDARFDYERFRVDMLSLPSASVRTSPEQVRGDYLYESTRIVATMFIHCLDTYTSLVHIPTTFVLALKLALQKTDIGGHWGMPGLFFFVALTGSAAAMRKPQHNFMATIISRADHEITYGNSVFEGAAIAAWRFQRLHKELLRRWEENCLDILRGTALDFTCSERPLLIGKLEEEVL